MRGGNRLGKARGRLGLGERAVGQNVIGALLRVIDLQLLRVAALTGAGGQLQLHFGLVNLGQSIRVAPEFVHRDQSLLPTGVDDGAAAGRALGVGIGVALLIGHAVVVLGAGAALGVADEGFAHEIVEPPAKVVMAGQRAVDRRRLSGRSVTVCIG